MRGIRIAMAVVALTAGVAPATAAAARTWHPTIQITPDGALAGEPAAALGERGEAVAAMTVSARGVARVEARVRRGTRSAWVRVPLSGALRRAPSRVAAAIDARGRAVVAWRIPGGRLRAAVRDRRDGPWRVLTVAPARPLDRPADFAVPAITIDAAGATTLAWAERAGGSWTLRVARRARPGASWTEQAPLRLGVVPSPALALDDDGAAVAAWTTPPAVTLPQPVGELHAVRRPPQGPWGPAATLGADAIEPDVAVAGGRAVVAWEERPGDDRTAARAMVAEDTGTGWSDGRAVAPGAVPRVAVNARGDMVATWAALPADPEATPILAALRPAGGDWGPPATLTPGRDMTWIEAASARVAMAGSGRAHVAWNDPEGPGSATTFLSTALAGGTWQTEGRAVGGDYRDIALDVRPGGDALALIPGDTMGNRVIGAADYDARLRATLSARGTGLRRADGAVRWRIVVRNTSRVAAKGVRMRLSICCGARLLSACPAGTPGARPWVVWRLGAIGAGRARTVTAVIRPGPGDAPRLFGDVSAVAVPATGITSRLP